MTLLAWAVVVQVRLKADTKCVMGVCRYQFHRYAAGQAAADAAEPIRADDRAQAVIRSCIREQGQCTGLRRPLMLGVDGSHCVKFSLHANLLSVIDRWTCAQVISEMVESMVVTLMDRFSARLGVPTSTLFPGYPAMRRLVLSAAAN